MYFSQDDDGGSATHTLFILYVSPNIDSTRDTLVSMFFSLTLLFVFHFLGLCTLFVSIHFLSLSLSLLDHQIFRFAPTTWNWKHNWINFLDQYNKYKPAKKRRRRKKNEWTLASSGTLTSLNKHQDFLC